MESNRPFLNTLRVAPARKRQDSVPASRKNASVNRSSNRRWGAKFGLGFGAHQKCSTSARIELPLLETVSGTTRVEGLRSSRGAASVFVVGGIEEG